MSKIARIFLIVLSAIIIATSFTALPVSSATSDQAVISNQCEDVVPLYTTAPDSSLKDYSHNEHSSKYYRLFYTQTTFLALLAGYLILFKVKGINHDEKMHRRRDPVHKSDK